MILETKVGPVEFADSLVQAVVRNGKFAAHLTVEVLKRIDPDNTRETFRWPRNHLLEFGSVLQIGFWEMSGISAHVEAGLPSHDNALHQLEERVKKGPKEFEGENAAPLHKEVLRFWVDNFAWEGPILLKTNIILGNDDEDQFLDLAADYLWQHRSELQNILTVKEEDNDEKAD